MGAECFAIQIMGRAESPPVHYVLACHAKEFPTSHTGLRNRSQSGFRLCPFKACIVHRDAAMSYRVKKFTFVYKMMRETTFFMVKKD